MICVIILLDNVVPLWHIWQYTYFLFIQSSGKRARFITPATELTNNNSVSSVKKKQKLIHLRSPTFSGATIIWNIALVLPLRVYNINATNVYCGLRMLSFLDESDFNKLTRVFTIRIVQLKIRYDHCTIRDRSRLLHPPCQSLNVTGGTLVLLIFSRVYKTLENLLKTIS